MTSCLLYCASESLLKKGLTVYSKRKEFAPRMFLYSEPDRKTLETKEILFCWLRSHVGIRGKEAADVKAKVSLDLDILNHGVAFIDFKPFINRYILTRR